MKRVFVHFRDEGKVNWDNKYYHFDRIPSEGEYLATEVAGDWYKVELVVHTPFTEEMSAEIYAVKVNRSEEMNMKLKN